MKESDSKKEICYRGGLVYFAIPTYWKEEYDEEVGGTFYEPGDNTGTLRLNVLSFLNEKDVSPTFPLVAFKKRAIGCNGMVEELSGNRFLLKYSINAEENGEPLVIYYWEVAKMVSPRDWNAAVFNFAILASQTECKVVQDEIFDIENEIKKVQFGTHPAGYKS